MHVNNSINIVNNKWIMVYVTHYRLIKIKIKYQSCNKLSRKKIPLENTIKI